MADSVLNSWKDIAAHLHTSVRTAQRWEAHFHLPIHRPAGTHKGPVLAFINELDQWIQKGGPQAAAANGKTGNGFLHHEQTVKIAPQLISTKQRAQRAHDLAMEVRHRAEELQQQLKRALSIRITVETKPRAAKTFL